MLKGDLASTPLAPLLLELANDSATGCLVIVDDTGDGDEAQLSTSSTAWSTPSRSPGRRPQLGAKLVSSGALAPEALADALEAQRTELQGWRLGELLVHLGYVEQTVVEAFVKEQVDDAMWDLMRWHRGRWRFRKNIKAREDVGPPMAVVEPARDAAGARLRVGDDLRGRPRPGRRTGAVHPRRRRRRDDSRQRRLVDAVQDRRRALGRRPGPRLRLHAVRGRPRHRRLVHAGLVDIEEDIDVAGQAPYGASTLSAAWQDNAESAENGRAWQRRARPATRAPTESPPTTPRATRCPGWRDSSPRSRAVQPRAPRSTTRVPPCSR